MLTESFKPYYKWITFNTAILRENLDVENIFGFKPYYKWITFNTEKMIKIYTRKVDTAVLNLIINGLPSIH